MASFDFSKMSCVFCTAGSIAICSIPGLSQVNNAAPVYVPAGLTVSVNNDVTNAGFIQNNGVFSLTGSWKNTSIYQGFGVMSLDGEDQNLDNNKQAIAHLTVNGGGHKTVATKITVTSAIDLNEGIVVVADMDTLLLSEDCKLSGGSDISYVDGALTTKGTGYRFYPIGKNGDYHPAELLDIKGVDPVIQMEVEQNLGIVTTSPVSTVMSDIYWTRHTIENSFISSPITLCYVLADTINQKRVAIAQGQNLTDPFPLLQNVSLEFSGGAAIIGSRKEATGDIFAISEILNDPSTPFYLSTTLSPYAVNPENRAIKLFGDGIGEDPFHFQVFNRWGISVYESRSLNEMQNSGWDGRQNGTMVSSGAYPYSLKYIDLNRAPVQKTGFIIVVR